MRLRNIFVLLFLAIHLAGANGIHTGEQQSALIIEGNGSDVINSFRSIVINNPEINFEVYRYPTIKGIGAGNGVRLDIESFEFFDYVLISVHQGALADEELSRLADYIEGGGRVLLMYQSFPKPYFIESIEENSNSILAMLGINDEIVYENAFFDKNATGSLQQISNEERIDNSSRKSINQLKRSKNISVTPYKAKMGSGHYFYKNSDLDDAKILYEFNTTTAQYTTSAFWSVGDGVLGIATERYSAGEPQRDVFAAWKAIWTAMNMETSFDPNDLDDTYVSTDPDYELGDRRLEQIARQEELNQQRLDAEMEEERKRKEEEFERYTAQQREKLENLKKQNELEQERLKRELQNQIAEQERINKELKAKQNSPFGEVAAHKEVYRSERKEISSTGDSVAKSEEGDWLEMKRMDEANLDLLESQMADNQMLIRNLNNVEAAFDENRLNDMIASISNDNSDLLLIETHLNYEDSKISNTLRSIRFSEKLKQYLVRQGISANRIIVKGVGSAYDMDDQVVIQEYKPRTMLHGGYERVNNEMLSSTAFDLYVKRNADIKFKIMLGSNPSSWDMNAIKRYGHFALEQFGSHRTIFGMVGLFDDPAKAAKEASQIQSWKVTAPKVVAYLDGIRLSDEQIEMLMPHYPVLRAFAAL